MPISRTVFAILGVATFVVTLTPGSHMQAQTAATSRFPVKPKPLGDSLEIALARSAAPSEVSANADIYLLRADGLKKVITGTNGCTCFVARDSHEGSLYPICYDREASRTSMHKEIMELNARMQGKSESEIKTMVAKAFADGSLKAPAKSALIYMMSSKQVLFSSPDSSGVRVGAWHPHLMIPMPFATAAQFGLLKNSKVSEISLENEGLASAQLIVVAAKWADVPGAAKH